MTPEREFLFRLALGLGKTVAEVEQMGSSELEEWKKFWTRDPWGSYRDNFHVAILCSLIANALRGKGKPAISFQEFMLTDKQASKARKTTEFINFLKAVAKPKKKASRGN